MRSRGRFLVLVAFLFLTSRLAAEAATYRVDRLTDANPAGGGVGSGHAGDLRYCINKARSGDIVAFDVAGTVHLAAALTTLTWNITIQGPAADKLTVRGAGSSVLHIGSGKVIVVSGVTVTGGSSNGGGSSIRELSRSTTSPSATTRRGIPPTAEAPAPASGTISTPRSR